MEYGEWFVCAVGVSASQCSGTFTMSKLGKLSALCSKHPQSLNANGRVWVAEMGRTSEHNSPSTHKLHQANSNSNNNTNNNQTYNNRHSLFRRSSGNGNLITIDRLALARSLAPRTLAHFVCVCIARNENQ